VKILKGRERLEEIGVDGSTVLILILRKFDARGDSSG
jgi:hypothetical protein